jgi:ketosteroid isomerase-like protein
MTVDVNAAAVKDEILRLDKEWAAAAADGRDVELILSFWSDDASVLPPGAPPIVGKAAIREFVTGALNTPGFSVTWKTIQVVLSAAGDLAYCLGPNRFTAPGPDGTIATTYGKAVTVWRNDPAGWKCVVDIWNDDPTAAAAFGK